LEPTSSYPLHPVGDTNLGTKGNPTIVLLPEADAARILNAWHGIQRYWVAALW